MKIFEISEPAETTLKTYECEICGAITSDPVFIQKTAGKQLVQAYICQHHVAGRRTTSAVGTESLVEFGWDDQPSDVLAVRNKVEEKAKELLEGDRKNE